MNMNNLCTTVITSTDTDFRLVLHILSSCDEAFGFISDIKAHVWRILTFSCKIRYHAH